ncbi:MAG: aspartate/glutamate racemase family protein [Myxococcales bacterium]
MLDWGIGGIGCYRLLKRELPRVPVIYWSDTGAVPYGKLPRRELTRRVERVLEALRRLGASHLVVACNAASTVLDAIASPLPTVGVIEVAQFAVPSDLRGTLAVIGGGRTVRSGLHRRSLARRGLRVVSRVAQPLSGHIEGGRVGSAAYRADLARIMAPITQADAVLLACTHYPAIAEDIQAELARDVPLLDPAQALIAQAVERFGLQSQRGADRFVTTGAPREMRAAARRAWGVTLPRCERVALR